MNAATALTITSRYAGTCAECAGQIPAGATVRWDRTSREIAHVECPSTTPRLGLKISARGAKVVAHPKPVIADRGPASFGHDAILPIDTAAVHSVHTRPLGEVLAAWRAQIAAEQCADVEIVHWRSPTPDVGEAGVYLRTTDGAIVLGEGGTLALTPTAWGQFVSLLANEIPGRPSGVANVLGFLSPEPRAIAVEDLKARTKRAEDSKHPLFVRTYQPATHTPRAVRAVLSGRHSGQHFDDAAIADAFERELPATAPAHVSRSVDGTSGYVVTDASDPHVHASVHFGNSETGCASLSFTGGARITAIGADVTAPASLVEVLVANENARTRRNHTLPRVRVTADERKSIADQRIGADLDRALDAARAMVGEWHEAKGSVAASAAALLDGWRNLAKGSAERRQFAEVVVDLIAERSKIRLTESLRARLQTVVERDETFARLDQGEAPVPFLSAAWVACAWALLARAEVDAAAFRALSDEAGRWLVERW